MSENMRLDILVKWLAFLSVFGIRKLVEIAMWSLEMIGRIHVK